MKIDAKKVANTRNALKTLLASLFQSKVREINRFEFELETVHS